MSQRAEPILPTWVRALDASALALMIIGLAVLVTGGFRESTPVGRLSVTSWGRPTALGLALFLLRHWRYRQPSLPTLLAASIVRSRDSIESRVVWPVFLSTRITVLAVGFFGIALLGYAPNTPPWRVYQNDFLNMPARWDTGWYLGIAENGYQFAPSQPGQKNVAFFPAYPLLIRYGSLLLGRQYLWAGVLISFAAFFFALKYVFRLAREHIGDDRAAAALALLAAYPFALFYSTAYTEALFLLTIAAACYHFERYELWRAAFWGVAAGLTRPNGCLLSIVLALIALRDYRTTSARAMTGRLLVAAAPGVGMLMFSTYVYILTGNPLQWAAEHAAFGRVYRSPGALIDDRIGYIQANGLYNYLSVLSLDVLNAVPIVFALSCVLPVYRRLGLPYAVMIVVNVLPPVLMGGVLSMGRVTAVLFPMFLWLGAAVPPRHRAAWLMSFAMLQALCAIAFFTWRPLV